MLWLQSVKGVRVAKKGDFAQLGGGGVVVSRELKEVESRGLRHSIDLVDMHMHGDFYINQLVQLCARVTLTRKRHKFKHTRNTLKRCSALMVRDSKKCYRDKVVEQEILHLQYVSDLP